MMCRVRVERTTAMLDGPIRCTPTHQLNHGRSAVVRTDTDAKSITTRPITDLSQADI